ncbi:MAG: helix-turn-helix domain-containing protein [Pirellulaceae bacterium]
MVEAVCDAFSVPAEHVRRRGSRRNRARLAAVYPCRSLTRRSVPEIGAYFGGVNGQAVSNLAGKMAHERNRDKKLNRRLSAIEKTLRQNG